MTEQVRVWRSVPPTATIEELSELDAREAFEFATSWWMDRRSAELDAGEQGLIESGLVPFEQLERPNFAEGLVTVPAGAVDVDHLECVQ